MPFAIRRQRHYTIFLSLWVFVAAPAWIWHRGRYLMQKKGGSQKSVGRHIINDMFPDGFNVPFTVRGSMIFIDAMFLVRVLPDTMETFKDIIDIFRRFITENMKETKGIILTFDRWKYVPKAKGEEQKNRNEKQSKRKRIISGPIPCGFDIHTPINFDFQGALGDRRGFRYDFIQWLSYQLLFGDPFTRISVSSSGIICSPGFFSKKKD